jgi:hypothetical protein
MAISNASPARFTPRGASDTLSAGDSPAGACAALTNLIPDPSTPHTYQCRPAAFQLTAFAGFNTPGVVSAGIVQGVMIYGLIGSAHFAGKDEPFAYNALTNSFVAITGTGAGVLPATQSSAGDWVPPTCDVMGTMVIFTHPGFPGAGVNFGWLDLTNPAAPVWHGGDLATTPMGAVPTNVQQFNNRAYFSFSNNQLALSDALTNPPTRTNASQQLTVDDATAITALSLMTLTTTTSGILQILLAFKAKSIYQVSGDPTTTNLAVNELNTASGTSSPRSVAETPEGCFYVDDDGLRCVLYSGEVTDPDPNIRVPFLKAKSRTRISAGYNGAIYRVCLQRSDLYGNPYQEWWLDLTTKQWSGPHTYRQDLALAAGHITSDTTGSFITFNSAAAPRMDQSDTFQNATSSFTEFGTALQFAYSTSPIGEPDSLYANSCTESTINLAYPATGQNYAITAADESGGALASAIITTPAMGSVWGLFNWLASVWGAAQFGLKPVKIPWTQPLVFSKVVVTVSGPCAAGFKIGALKMLYKVLGYML